MTFQKVRGSCSLTSKKIVDLDVRLNKEQLGTGLQGTTFMGCDFQAKSCPMHKFQNNNSWYSPRNDRSMPFWAGLGRCLCVFVFVCVYVCVCVCVCVRESVCVCQSTL